MHIQVRDPRVKANRNQVPAMGPCAPDTLCPTTRPLVRCNLRRRRCGRPHPAHDSHSRGRIPWAGASRLQRYRDSRQLLSLGSGHASAHLKGNAPHHAGRWSTSALGDAQGLYGQASLVLTGASQPTHTQPHPHSKGPKHTQPPLPPPPLCAACPTTHPPLVRARPSAAPHCLTTA